MNVTNFIQLSVCAAAITCSSLVSAKIFQSKDGILVMEAESTKSRLGKWKKQTSVKDFTGDSHLEFTGNKPPGGSPASPLKYTFRVDKNGDYQLMIRGFKRLDGEAPDRCNDCYVKLDGDFEAVGDVPLKLLKADTKLYGGSDKEWGWAVKLDDKHKKYNPIYKLKAGEEYTLTISGRSKRFNIDRIIFKHTSVKKRDAMDAKLTESPTSIR